MRCEASAKMASFQFVNTPLAEAVGQDYSLAGVGLSDESCPAGRCSVNGWRTLLPLRQTFLTHSGDQYDRRRHQCRELHHEAADHCFSPTSGTVGTAVTITGYNFTGANGVTFNGRPATFTAISGTQISASVPAGAATGKIRVTTPLGSATSSTDFNVTSGQALGASGSNVRMAIEYPSSPPIRPIPRPRYPIRTRPRTATSSPRSSNRGRARKSWG